jgi:non-ribosomal peptide synthetase component F
MDRMAQHLSNLLTAVTAQSEAPLSSLGFMSAEEQQLVLHTFNDTAGQAPAMCVHTFFERQAAATPQVSCLIDSATGSSLTYAEVNSAANRLARHLSSVGIATDTPVAILMDKCFEAYIALIAVLKAGGETCALAANPQHQEVSVCTATILGSHPRPCDSHLCLLSDSHMFPSLCRLLSAHRPHTASGTRR